MADLPLVACMPAACRNDALALFSTLRVRAHAAGASLRPPPSEPTTCCGRGCHGCVWEGFYSAANYWHEEALRLLPP